MMREYKTPRSHSYLAFCLPDDQSVEWIAPVEVPAAPDPAQLTRR